MQVSLPVPGFGESPTWVERHLGDLVEGPVISSGRFRGGQTNAGAALAAFDVAGYAARRNQVWPDGDRGASALSPYIRHGLLTLPRVWAAVAGGPARDVAKFRDELAWQEYARHLYARLGSATGASIRFEPHPARRWDREPWPRDMACVGTTLDELETDGWIPNQARMWLSSQWAVRAAEDWRGGEDLFFRHLLDGSRAANRLGWQWTAGAGTGRPYGFARGQVERRAPGLCATCPHCEACPIEHFPETPELVRVPDDPRLRRSDGAEAGPGAVVRRAEPEVVWVTAESMGDGDPALAANPGLSAVFVFDEPLLSRLQLSAKRLVFLVETLADLAERRPVELFRGRPADVLAQRMYAVTYTPVPGWKRVTDRVSPAEVHPWPWLRRPSGGSVASFSQWSRGG